MNVVYGFIAAIEDIPTVIDYFPWPLLCNGVLEWCLWLYCCYRRYSYCYRLFSLASSMSVLEWCVWCNGVLEMCLWFYCGYRRYSYLRVGRPFLLVYFLNVSILSMLVFCQC